MYSTFVPVMFQTQMVIQKMHDPRALANEILDEAEKYSFRVTNLALQKLLYFAHSLYLIENEKPLVTGYFEAWQYGPVHPAVYQCFKQDGSDPIQGRAKAIDPVTFVSRPIAPLNDPDVKRLVATVVSQFGRLTPGRLVDITHAKNGPWDFVVASSKNSGQLGLRITDDVIRDRFKFHKVAIGPAPTAGEPDEDAPFA